MHQIKITICRSFGIRIGIYYINVSIGLFFGITSYQVFINFDGDPNSIKLMMDYK